MGAKWNLDTIVAAFPDAAVDPTRWNAAMEAACEVTESSGALLFSIHGPSPLPVFPRSESMSPAVDVYLRDGWVHRDERYKLGPKLKKKGVHLVTDLDGMNADAMARHPYYQEFLAPFALRWYAGVKVECGDDLWALSMQHSIEQGPYSKEELNLFSDLSVRLSAVAALARMLGFAKAEAALEVFQASGRAAVLTGARGQVFRTNAAAEKLLGADLQIRERRLVSSDRNATAALQRALQQLLVDGSDLGSQPIVLPRREARPIVAYPIRLTSFARDIFTPARAAVVLIDLEGPTGSADILRSVFGLSQAEAKIAERLCCGESLESVADALGITYETARSQLKAVFAKTETRRQVEMVALASRLATSTPHSRK